MTEIILSNITASITELKLNPMGTVESAMGEPIAILNHNKPAFYCIPAEKYEQILEHFDDTELVSLIKKRSGEKEVEVDINEL